MATTSRHPTAVMQPTVYVTFDMGLAFGVSPGGWVQFARLQSWLLAIVYSSPGDGCTRAFVRSCLWNNPTSPVVGRRFRQLLYEIEQRFLPHMLLDRSVAGRLYPGLPLLGEIIDVMSPPPTRFAERWADDTLTPGPQGKAEGSTRSALVTSLRLSSETVFTFPRRQSADPTLNLLLQTPANEGTPDNSTRTPQPNEYSGSGLQNNPHGRGPVQTDASRLSSSGLGAASRLFTQLHIESRQLGVPHHLVSQHEGDLSSACAGVEEREQVVMEATSRALRLEGLREAEAALPWAITELTSQQQWSRALSILGWYLEILGLWGQTERVEAWLRDLEAWPLEHLVDEAMRDDLLLVHGFRAGRFSDTGLIAKVWSRPSLRVSERSRRLVALTTALFQSGELSTPVGRRLLASAKQLALQDEHDRPEAIFMRPEMRPDARLHLLLARAFSWLDDTASAEEQLSRAERELAKNELVFGYLELSALRAEIARQSEDSATASQAHLEETASIWESLPTAFKSSREGRLWHGHIQGSLGLAALDEGGVGEAHRRAELLWPLMRLEFVPVPALVLSMLVHWHSRQRHVVMKSVDEATEAVAHRMVPRWLELVSRVGRRGLQVNRPVWERQVREALETARRLHLPKHQARFVQMLE